MSHPVRSSATVEAVHEVEHHRREVAKDLRHVAR
jgi:hypothetical protein